MLGLLNFICTALSIDIEGLASILITDPDPDAPFSPTAFAFAAGPTGGNFTLTFEEISKIIFPTIGSPVGHGAPTFLAIFRGSGPPVVGPYYHGHGGGYGPPEVEFVQPFLCSLLPTDIEADLARADCVASLDPLTEQGFVPIITIPDDAPTQTFTLSARLENDCHAENLNFVGSDVVPGTLDPSFVPVGFMGRRRSLNGPHDTIMIGNPAVNQQVVLTGTRVFIG